MARVKLIGTCAAAVLMGALTQIPTEPAAPGEHRLSERGYAVLIGLESCRTEPYKCSANRWTNGVGNTNNVNPNKKIDEVQAAKDLKNNVAKFEKAVNSSVKVQIKQPVFDAMVIFSFNVGVGAFKSSTALRELNRGHIANACRWLLPWNKITVYENGKATKAVSAGLKVRRRKEYDLCMEGAK